MILIYTGNGKGKTSAAIGQVVRALGHGGRAAVAQFIKQDPNILDSGEAKILKHLGVTWKSFGAGFTWIEGNDEKNRILAPQGWVAVKEWLESGAFDIIVLDEFTYTLNFGYIDGTEVAAYLKAHRGKEGFAHIVITGRDAPKELIEIADMVSDVGEVKHHLTNSGIEAAPMIEF